MRFRYTLEALFVAVTIYCILLTVCMGLVDLGWKRGYKEGFEAAQSQQRLGTETHIPILVDDKLKGWIKR